MFDLYVGRISSGAKKIKMIQTLVQRLANEQSSYSRAALRLRQFRGAVCWRLFSLFRLSPLSSFLFFTLPPPPLSVSALFSKTDLGKRAPGKQSHGWYWGHLGSICRLWLRMKHLYFAQKPQNRSSGEAKTQNQQNPL
jgi:hypothetical protein